MLVLAILLQAAQPAQPAPDIELNLNIRARSFEIRQKGEAKLEVRGEGPGNRMDVRMEPKAEGRARLRNVEVKLRAEASVREGAKIDARAETGTPR